MRRAAFWLGLAVLALAWAMPPLGGTAFTTRMMAHLGTVALAAPLLAIGLAGREPWLGPVPASLVELVVVWLWHVPALRALTADSWTMAAVEQGSFLLAGFLLWHACLGGARSDARRAAGAFGLLLTSVHMTLLGVLLALAPRPLYGGGDVTCFGVTLGARQDQELGGVLMLLVGAAVYLAGGVALLARLLAAPAQRA